MQFFGQENTNNSHEKKIRPFPYVRPGTSPIYRAALAYQVNYQMT